MTPILFVTTAQRGRVCALVCVFACGSASVGADLEDGVHGACEWPVVGVQSHAEDVQPPLVDVLQVLLGEW